MAKSGHRISHHPQLIHLSISFTYGFPASSLAKAPVGQKATQIPHALHQALKISIFGVSFFFFISAIIKPKSSRLLKNAHLLRFPPPSSLQRTSKYASGRLTNSSAWQDVAPYSSRRHSQDFGGPRRRDFAKGNLHLPACAKSRLAGRRQGHF